MDLAQLTIHSEGSVPVARLAGELDLSNVREIGSAITRALSNEALGLVLDVTEVTYLDSSAMQAIFDVREGLARRGQRLWLVVPEEARIADALRIGGVTAAIPSAATVEEARMGILDAEM